jgi:uncharacterized protein
MIEAKQFALSIAGVAISREDGYDRFMKIRSAPQFVCALLLAAAVLFFPVPAAAGETFPKPSGAVNDFAGVIAAQYKAPMENLAREVLEKTGTAVVVATVETLGGSDENDYANRLYSAWGIGRKGEDKGVLIFLAVKERRVRIETGYGVEGILPDGLTGEILDRYAIPRFREGDYGKGLAETMAAVSAVVAKAAGATLTGAQPQPQRRPARTERGLGIGQIVLFVLAIGFLLGTRQGRALLPWLLLLMMSGGGRRGGDGFGGFGGGGFGGFGGGSSGGGGSSRGF